MASGRRRRADAGPTGQETTGPPRVGATAAPPGADEDTDVAGVRATTRRARAPVREASGPVPAGEPLETRNDVALVGRVAAPAEERTLPSGDVLATWRLVVDRPHTGRRVPEGRRAVTVDTLDCVAWAAGARRTARSLATGDVVAVDGALRRRFWRAGAGAVSRCEVEVTTVKRLRRAG